MRLHNINTNSGPEWKLQKDFHAVKFHIAYSTLYMTFPDTSFT